jgi:aquaporin NIP
MKRFCAEILGTFALVFAGTGAIVINEASGGAITHVGIALTFGLIVLAMIYTVGDISGAHLNPAVTLGFWAARRLPGRDVLPYITSQFIGATLASGLLRFLFPENKLLGATLPAGSESQSFVLETVLTFFLMLTILNVSTGAKEKGVTAGIGLRRVHESRAFARARARLRPFRASVDLSHRSAARRRRRDVCLPLRARKRLLHKIKTRNRIVKL